MQLRSDSKEPEHIVSLAAPRLGESPVEMCKGISADRDDPPLTTALSPVESDDVALQYDGKRSLLLTTAWLAVVVLLHLLGLWWLEQRPTHQLPPLDRGKPYRVSIVDARSLEQPVDAASARQAAAALASAQARNQTAAGATQARDVKRPARQRASRESSRPTAQPARRTASRSATQNHANSRQQPRSGSAPSAQELINQVSSAASSNGWEDAADRFAAGPSTNAERNAVSRYIAYFTRSVQTYIDLNLGSEASGNARMELGIKVGRDGRLRSVWVIQSTGRDDLDRLAVRTIHRAGPFRPFDAGMGNLPELTFSRTWVFGEGAWFRFQ